MANKSKKPSSSKPATSDANVVRIKASESAPKKTKIAKTESKPAKSQVVDAVILEPAKPKKQPKVKNSNSGKGILTPLFAIGNYFKGAWYELRQVRWPNRRATWSLTGAVLAYSAFFVVLVLLLDAAFKYLFELILGK